MQEFIFKDNDDGTACAVSYQGNDAEVVIPERWCEKPVTVLYDRLFKGHSEITSVKIPDCVTDIGASVFDGCEGLTSIELPKSLVYMWQYAFVRSSIEEVVIPEGVTDIVPFTFKDCKKLRRVVCPATLRKIGSWAFQGCDRLEKVEASPETEISPKAYAE